MRARSVAIAISLFLFLGAAAAVAQTTGSIEGRAADEAGGVLPGVTVEAREPGAPGRARRDDGRRRAATG